MTSETGKIVDRLLVEADWDARAGEPLGKRMREAAALIRSQAARIAELEAGLGPFAKAAERLHEAAIDTRFAFEACALIRVGDLRRARSLLEGRR